MHQQPSLLTDADEMEAGCAERSTNAVRSEYCSGAWAAGNFVDGRCRSTAVTLWFGICSTSDHACSGTSSCGAPWTSSWFYSSLRSVWFGLSMPLATAAIGASPAATRAAAATTATTTRTRTTTASVIATTWDE